MKKQNIRGLTLIEVVIIIAIVILLIIFLPAIFPHRGPRDLAINTVCQTNQKIISNTIIQYTKDNDDKLVSSDTFANNDKSNWISEPMQKNKQPVNWQNVSQESEITGIRNSLIFKYMHTDEIRTFHCPAKEKYYANSPLGYRNYSIPSTLNGTDLPEEWKKYRYLKLDNIKNATETLMLVEEADTRGFNYNGWFQNPEKTDTIIDSIGLFHYGNYDKFSNFTFCDGHVKAIKCNNPKTIEYFENYMKTNIDGNFNFTDQENIDIQLIHKYYPAKGK